MTDENDDIARKLNNSPKYVVSSTLNEKQTQWNGTTVIKSDVAGAVTKLKAQPGKDILVIGSSELAQTLIQHNLVDEYLLMLHPVVLGGGKRLFRDGGPKTTLRLVNSETTGNGLVVLTYQPDKQ